MGWHGVVFPWRQLNASRRHLYRLYADRPHGGSLRKAAWAQRELGYPSYGYPFGDSSHHVPSDRSDFLGFRGLFTAAYPRKPRQRPPSFLPSVFHLFHRVPLFEKADYLGFRLGSCLLVSVVSVTGSALLVAAVLVSQWLPSVQLQSPAQKGIIAKEHESNWRHRLEVRLTGKPEKEYEKLNQPTLARINDGLEEYPLVDDIRSLIKESMGFSGLKWAATGYCFTCEVHIH